MPSPVTFGLSVTALLAVVGAGAALLPSSFTGSGTAAEHPEAAVAALVPGAGGGAPGTGVARPPAPPSSPAATPSTAAPKPSRTATKKPATKKPVVKKTPTRRPTTSAPKVGAGLAAQESEVIRLVNVERDRAGCGSVELNTKLRAAIRLHVQELGTHGDLYISHVSDDGRDFVTRAKAQGYNDPGGENVARGQRDAADVMTSWMNSDGHRANILNCDFKALGVGAVKGVDGTTVWGQLFGRS
ncbi:CAP domain-containing protein [Actinoplanes sp. NPDC048967]|uniref:CAP domain-containing protein n=1 Tax=Actinoplanes sp. NPDC048967 TaxID=3155269 RepID=UPI0033FE5A4B